MKSKSNELLVIILFVGCGGFGVASVGRLSEYRRMTAKNVSRNTICIIVDCVRFDGMGLLV
jgi:hypothetical protein